MERAICYPRYHCTVCLDEQVGALYGRLIDMTSIEVSVFPVKECQKKLEHKLGLDSYLLKPVQRLTKYQLLLKVSPVRWTSTL